MIKVERILATNQAELEQQLNNLFAARVISVERGHDSWWNVIYEI